MAKENPFTEGRSVAVAMDPDMIKSKPNCMLSSLLNCDYSFINLISPEMFCSCLISQLQTKLENESCTVGKDNSQLISLSALINLLDIKGLDHIPGHLSSELELGKSNHTEIIKDWLNETLNILSKLGKDIIHTMISTLQCKRNKFVVFLVRKALFTGLKTGVWKVEQILEFLDVYSLASGSHCLWVVELLKGLVVHALQRKRESEIILSWFECHCVLQRIFTVFQISDSPSDISELLSLLKKLVKLATANLDPTEKDRLAYLKKLFCEVLFPNVQLVLQVCAMKQQNIVQYLKVVDNILVTQWLHPDQTTPNVVLDILKAFHSLSPEFLNSLQSGDVFSNTNFIGKEKKRNSIYIDKFHLSSNLLRYITLVFLKSCALSSKTSQNLWIPLQPFLQVFHWTLEEPRDDTSVQKWFIAHFADQDSHWITSLFSLLIIYKHLKLRCSELHTTSNLGTDVSTPQEFLLTFCPHKVFLHFVEFIDYDHLVLSDFLISPETSFLPYILNFLHFVLEDWGYFKKITSSHTQFINSKQTGHMPEEQCNKFVGTNSKIEDESNLSKSSGKNILKCPNPAPSVHQTLQIVTYSDTDSDDSLPSPPLSKKYCVEQEMKTQDNILLCDTASQKIYEENAQSLKFDIETNQFEEKIERLMGMFIRLRFHIDRLQKKGLFPYRARALLKLLMACEEKYEM